MNGPTKILVIDDEPVVCSSCEGILSADGHHVSTALTGEEGMSKVENEHFDIVLLDLKIPGCGGLNLLRAIRQASPQTEVVVITGYPTLENAKESIRLGAFEYVAKPFVPQDLCSVVRKAISCQPWAIQKRC